MDKKIIKDRLTQTFISEAKDSKKKVDNGKANKDGVAAIEKDVKAFEKNVKKKDPDAKTMGPNKFNFNSTAEKENHDEMETLNGMEMLQYDREPDDLYKKRALEGIEGSSKMGNNPEWANVVAKGQGGDPDFGKNLVKRIKSSAKKRSEETPTFYMHGKDNSVEMKDTGHKPYALESVNNNSNSLPTKDVVNENKTQKQTMKRLKFKKEFNGVGNALKLIPEAYREDNKVFQMTDGNESYTIRWEGSLTEGSAVVLSASDKTLINEDVQKMKHLFNYKSETTLGLVKGKDRVNEDTSFADIWAKSKKLLGESEDIEGQTAEEGEWDDAGITQSPDAKKHIQGSVSTEKGTVAPAPKNGEWDKIKISQSSDAKKHVQGSVSTDKGTVAPAPKEGHWDKIKIHAAANPTGGLGGSTPKATATETKPDNKKSQAPEAKKHVQGSVSSDKGTVAPAAKNGEWDKIKKKAPEATKDIKNK